MNRSAFAMTDFNSRRSTARSSMPLLDEELRTLEAFRKFLTNGLLDDAWTRKSDLGLGFADVQIAEHREARADAAGRGIGQHRDVRQARAIESCERTRIFAICMSDSAPSIMRAPPRQHDDERTLLRDGTFDGARDLSPTTTPMLPPMKAYSCAAITVSMPSMAPGRR